MDACFKNSSWLWVWAAVILFSPGAGALEWPPALGKPYPDLELVNQDGKKTKLSQFKGSVILVEPVGMTCPACQAFSGGNRVGGFGGVGPQKGLDSIEEYLPQYAAGTKLDHPKLVLVQLLLYSLSMKAPTAEDARAWAKHFGLETKKRQYVLAGTPALIGKASYDMIPGFQLVDRDFILRSDSSGHHPRHSLWNELLPLVPKLLK